MSRRMRNVALGAACVAVIGCGSYLPAVYMKKQDRLMYKDGKLTGTQRQRGMYLNAGSEDIGRDPDWDPQTNTWKGSYSTSSSPSLAFRTSETGSDSGSREKDGSKTE